MSPYNFFVFPNAHSNDDIIMAPSSIDFLCQHNMNFQTWISKGIGFTDENGQTFLEKKYNQNQSSHQDPSVTTTAAVATKITLTKDTDKEYMNRNISQLKDMILNYHNNNNSTKTYTFEPSNSFLRRVVYEYLSDNYPPPSYIASKGTDYSIVVTIHDSPEDTQKHMKELEIKYNQEMGLRLLFNELVACKKPLIGHHCMYDFMFLMKTFDQCPLYDDFSTFKSRLYSYFPIVFDTKYIATSGVIHGTKYDKTVLQDLYITMKNEVDINIIQKNDSNSNNNNHKASTSPTSLGRQQVNIMFAEDVPAYVDENQYHDAGMCVNR